MEEVRPSSFVLCHALVAQTLEFSRSLPRAPLPGALSGKIGPRRTPIRLAFIDW